jgi:putative phosphoesterase
VKLAVIADIHGNLPALEAVLGEIEPLEVDGLIAAGDYTGGPHPNETLRLLRSIPGWMIRGNGDEMVLRFLDGDVPPSWAQSRQWALARWTCSRLEADNLEFLRSLPSQRTLDAGAGPRIRVVHGSLSDPAESIFPHLDPDLMSGIFARLEEGVLICGHTHQSWVLAQDGKLALNPGAVCGPLSGLPGAEYALMTWQGDHWGVELCRVSYDIGVVRAAFHHSGLLREGGALARAFLRSIETGRDIVDDFLIYAYRLAGEAGHGNPEVIPDTVWDHAAETFGW